MSVPCRAIRACAFISEIVTQHTTVDYRDIPARTQGEP
jgi:hypothetical protein